MIVAHILTDVVSSKLDYVLDYIFVHTLGLEYIVTTDITAFSASPHKIKINYTTEELEGVLSIQNSAYFTAFDYETIPEIESVLEFKNGTTNFDLYAGIFFLLARVEEYSSPDVDEHGRYLSSASQLAIKGWLELPVVDIWLHQLVTQLDLLFGLSIKRPEYCATSTIDVDHIYAYKGKPAWQSFATFTRDILTLQGEKLKARLGQDPFDKYQEMIEVNAQYGFNPIFFVLTSAKAKYDRSLPPDNPHFIRVIKQLSKHHQVTIHPSYASNDSQGQLEKEVHTLASIIGKPIYQSRQHYLRLSLPHTYRRLITCGLSEDHTMGYADTIGFRAGTSRPFFWYDLEKDVRTTLKVIPFCLMDVTLRKYKKLQPSEAIEHLKPVIQQLKKVGGHCSFIWHNSSYYAAEGWAGWDKVYSQLLQIARP